MTLVYFSSCEPSNHDYIFTYYFIFVFFSLFIYNELAFPMLGPPRFWLVTNHHADIFLFFPQEKRIHLFFSIHILVFFFFFRKLFSFSYFRELKPKLYLYLTQLTNTVTFLLCIYMFICVAIKSVPHHFIVLPLMQMSHC